MNLLLHLLHLLLFFFAIILQPSSATDFVINSFDSSKISLFGNATIRSQILTLTNETTFSIGRALYPAKIRAKNPNSSYVLPFSTSFIFAMAPSKLFSPGHGLVFIFVPRQGIQGAEASQNMGLVNITLLGNSGNHLFGVEFDCFKNQEFRDRSDQHVGIDLNSLISDVAEDSGYWNGGKFTPLKMNDGRTYQVWIDYADSLINVTMAPAGTNRPATPLLKTAVNLTGVFEEEMYVGFTASTGQLVQSHLILGWSFSNSNFSLSDALVTKGLPSFELPETPLVKKRGFIVGITVLVLVVLVLGSFAGVMFVRRLQRKRREREEMEDWELEYWPHRMTYQEIEAATKIFDEANVIGCGANGNVYRGVLPGGSEVAVKRISHQNSEGMREFVSEVSSLGRLKHRNLVGLRGWCKKEKGSFIVVYDYMENGSLDARIFNCGEEKMLSCEERIRILKDVASALFYLHEGWESKVLHRDIKAGNVLLDREMNARLGDFGLARMHDHSEAAATTRVVGTIGYMAPELMKNGRASSQTDVFSYGVLILEVLCGRLPIEDGKPILVDWVWELMKRNELMNALDSRLRAFDKEEVERVLHLGLLCAHPDPSVRPTMRMVVKFLEGKSDETENGLDDDDMETYLLERMMKNRDVLWPDFSLSMGSYSQLHPTYPSFEEIREGLSSSMSLSWSKSMEDGR